MGDYTQGLAGKVALVTGAAQRIGAAVVRTLHGQGMQVAVHYRRSREAAEALAAELEAVRPGSVALLQSELLDRGRLERLVEKALAQWGRLDVLVNNASSFYPTAVGSVSAEAWDDLLGINLKVPFFLSQAVAPHLRSSRGCIVNLADIHGLKPLREHAVYSVAKAGLVMLTRALAYELGPEVRVNAVAPGAILWPEQGLDEVTRQRILSRTALKRQGSPEDVARAVLFLVRDADYVTGQVLPVDGGRAMVTA
jgi:pteridine reductase